MRAIFGLVLAIAVVAGCASKPRDPDVAGLLDVGDGRALYLDCRGSGSPAVLIIPGKGSYAEMWNVVVPADDPIRTSPYDIVGQANLQRSPTATQPTVAKTTRVCAYDRPNTRSDGTDRATPVPQPQSVQQDVDDVVTSSAAGSWEIVLRAQIAVHGYGRPEGKDGKVWTLAGLEPVHAVFPQRFVGTLATTYASRGAQVRCCCERE